MMRKQMLVEVEIEDCFVQFRDEEELEWFMNFVLGGGDEGLQLHSNDLGETLGHVIVLAIADSRGELITLPWSKEKIEKELSERNHK